MMNIMYIKILLLLTYKLSDNLTPVYLIKIQQFLFGEYGFNSFKLSILYLDNILA